MRQTRRARRERVEVKHDRRSRKPGTRGNSVRCFNQPVASYSPVAILAAIASHRSSPPRASGEISAVSAKSHGDDEWQHARTLKTVFRDVDPLQTMPVNRQRHRDFVTPIRLGPVEPRFDAPIAALTLRLGMTV